MSASPPAPALYDGIGWGRIPPLLSFCGSLALALVPRLADKEPSGAPMLRWNTQASQEEEDSVSCISLLKIVLLISKVESVK